VPLKQFGYGDVELLAGPLRHQVPGGIRGPNAFPLGKRQVARDQRGTVPGELRDSLGIQRIATAK
jgi:hypothetical protein